MSDLEALLDRLVAAGVLVEVDDDRLDLGSAFRRERETQRARLAEADEETLASLRERYADALAADRDAVGTDVLADVRALQALDGDVDDHGAVVAADALRRFDDETLADGVPDGFVPVRPDEVHAFLERHEGSVLYFWGDDCEPCEAIREEFEGLVRNGRVPGGIGLGAVYLGAEADVDEADVELIAEDWQVTVVPTTLFFDGQSINARLIGAKKGGHLEREMEILMEEYVAGGERTDGRTTVDELLEAKARGELDGHVVDIVEETDPEAMLTADIDDLLVGGGGVPADSEQIAADMGLDPEDVERGETGRRGEERAKERGEERDGEVPGDADESESGEDPAQESA